MSMLAAVSVLIFPELNEALPAWAKAIAASETTVAVVVSMLLNALFLLGTWRTTEVRLGADGTPLTAAAFDAFFDAHAALGKLPADDIRRIRAVVDDAIERVAPTREAR